MKYNTIGIGVCLAAFVLACNLGTSAGTAPLGVGSLNPEASPVFSASPSPEPSLFNPSAGARYSVDGWEIIAEGLEYRVLVPPEGDLFQMVALRIDPMRYQFRAHYAPTQAYPLETWLSQLPEPVALVNANFFHPDHTILGFLVSDGLSYGRAFTDRGGWFGVQNGVPFVRHSIYEPYQGEALEQAVQAFPMLVWQGQATQTNPRDTRPSRRTVIGQDAQGRILLMATPALGLGFYPLSQFLAQANLGLVNAFNLDGGGSTMLWLGGVNYRLASFDGVPAVLAVYPR